MRDHLFLCCGFARGALLLAGLLFLFGTVAEPLVHAVQPGAERGTIVLLLDGAEPAPTDFEDGGTHDESQCLLCKTAGSIVQVVTEPVAATSPVAHLEVFAGVGAPRAPPSRSGLRSRAPPLA